MEQLYWKLGFVKSAGHIDIKPVFSCDIHAHADEDVCREVIVQYKRIMEETDDAQKVSLYESIIHHIARHNATVGNQLETEYLNAASNSTAQAKLYFEDWYVLLTTYADAERLTAYLQNEAEKRPNWVRTFQDNAHLIGHSTYAWVLL